jgi:hypothetical protein
VDKLSLLVIQHTSVFDYCGVSVVCVCVFVSVCVCVCMTVFVCACVSALHACMIGIIYCALIAFLILYIATSSNCISIYYVWLLLPHQQVWDAHQNNSKNSMTQ